MKLRRGYHPSRPGGNQPSRPTTYQVIVPENVRPGDVFIVNTGSRFIHVRCPPNTRPGEALTVSLRDDEPPNPPAPNPSAPNPPPVDSDNVKPIPGSSDYMVTIPRNVQPGEQFHVTIQGRDLTVTCPSNARPGMSVRITPPLRPSEPSVTRARPEPDFFQYEVNVPDYVQPGQQFYLMAGGQRVLVTCPLNAKPGARIRFEVPKEIINRPEFKPTNERELIIVIYGKDGWSRKIRPDMKFQWVREDTHGEVDVRKRFDIERSAYVRKLDLSPDYLSTLCLVPATMAVVDSKIRDPNGGILASYKDIADAQAKSFDEKAAWFEKICRRLHVPWNEGHVQLNIRRESLLGDSVNAVMSVTRKDFRKSWRIEFIGEGDNGIDAGGVSREWFQLVTEELFDPNWGFWKSNAVNQMNMMINPASGLCNEMHLVYYRALGRIMGKALFDRQLVSCHMAQYLYKHILAWPITFADIEQVDEEYFRSLKQVVELGKQGGDLANILCMSFTTTQEVMDSKEEIELVEGGTDIEVTNDNYPEYLEACLKYRMLDHVKPQLTELLFGFFEVIPEPLLTIFDFQELELLMCGLPEIDIDDWRENTEYSGTFEATGGYHEVCEWFWEVVSELDQEMKARLLQFVTGTSGVPAAGFGVLQGIDGNIRPFTIHGVKLSRSSPQTVPFPRSHTCFNRIDLPMYTSKKDLKEKLTVAVMMAAVGFGIE